VARVVQEQSPKPTPNLVLRIVDGNIMSVNKTHPVTVDKFYQLPAR
jgi:hypothetical protein